MLRYDWWIWDEPGVNVRVTQPMHLTGKLRV